MSFGRRLFNIARAEIREAAKRLKGESVEPLVEERLGHEEPRREAPKTPDEPPEVRRYYANLELPIGASAAEVKAAYRRLMRRYHPDKHHGDPDKADVANRLTQELRTAYEGLMRYLNKTP